MSDHPTSARMEKKNSSPSRQPGSPHNWDFECGFTSDPLVPQGRIRASSWDDSDDNLPPIPDNLGSKTCRIYSSDDKKSRSCAFSEIDELKKQFFKNLQKVKENQESLKLEGVREEIETKLNFDRRLSPARIRRRSKSSGSSSSVAEAECPVSPTKMNKSTEFEYQEINPKFIECDGNSYLANFFTELRSRRIGLLDSKSELEKLGQEVPNYDGESTPMQSLDKDSDEYFCKTSRKLSKILEVEENKKDLEKSSEENTSDSNLFQKCFAKPENYFSPLQTARSKKSKKIPENQEETQKKEERFRSLSSEHGTNFQKPQKLLQGNLTDRTSRFFSKKLDDDFITLSVKCGKTQLASKKCWDDKQTNTPMFNPKTPKWTDKNCSEDHDHEKNVELMKLLKIDLTKRSEDMTPRKSSNRSDQTTNTSTTRSGKSRKSWNTESPKFRLNIGMDSGRSLRVEDVNPIDTKLREEESSLRKRSSCNSDSSSEAKTERTSQKSMRSTSVESEISTRWSFQEPDPKTSRSRSQNSTHRSHRKKRKQSTDTINVESETREPNSARSIQSERTELSSARVEQIKEPNLANLARSETKPNSARLEQFKRKEPNSTCSMQTGTNKSGSVKSTEQQSPTVSFRSSEISANTSCRSKCSGSDDTPNSKSSRISESPKVRTEENKFPDQSSHEGTPRSKKIPEFGLPLDISERPKSQKSSHRGIQTELVTKDDDRTESQSRSRRRSEQNSSSRTRNTEYSPSNLKMTPRTSSGSSRRSKDSLENENFENFRLTSWKELEKVSDSIHTSISSASNRSNERETEIPSLHHSYRSEIYNPELGNSITVETSEVNNTLKEQHSGSRNSSKTSLDSNNAEWSDNNSPDKSAKAKARPNSWTAKECTLAILPDDERQDINPISGRTGSSITEEEEDLEENHTTQKSKIGDESLSSKRLSVINEVSFEDIESSNMSTEKEDTWDQSRKKSNRETSQTPESSKSVKKPSPKDEPNASSWRTKEMSNSIDDSTSIDLGKGEEWTELISKFQKESNSIIFSNSLPGFARQNEISWNSIKVSEFEENNLADCDEGTSNKNSLGSKTLERNLFERPLTGEKDVNNYNIAYQNFLLDKTNQDFTPPFQTHHNIHYVNVDISGPFGIGEFGDVTCWDPEKLKFSGDTKDNEKPKDHGDGIPYKIPEIPPRKSEKTEKELKNQRQLWRDFTPVLSKPFLEAHVNHISCPLKASKSNDGNINKESDFDFRASSFLLNDYKQNPEPFEESWRTNKETKSSNTISQRSSSDSLEIGREFELDYERTPRISRSLSNLGTRIEETPCHREPSETLSVSGDELLKKTHDRYKAEKESTNLSIFLEGNNKDEKNTNNWLKLKQDKRTKRKLKKKGAVALGEPFHNYLSTRKTRSSVSTLKLRHPNCFQNFYKRFISVFCITSNSSTATSK